VEPVTKRKNEFAEDDKIRILLWCNRHCCLCGRAVGANIEIAHLEASSSDIDDAIPLCFTCHAEVGRFNPKHPKGRKYQVAELKSRREQIYEQHTRPLVPPVNYGLRQRIEGRNELLGQRELPDVGFEIVNLGDRYPVRARIVITLVQGSQTFRPVTAGHYDGSYLWNLNPQLSVQGHFAIPESILKRKEEPLRAKVEVTLIDILQRPHTLLPVGYIHNLRPKQDWYFEPSIEELARVYRLSFEKVQFLHENSQVSGSRLYDLRGAEAVEI
jgi:hypothetical protein